MSLNPINYMLIPNTLDIEKLSQNVEKALPIPHDTNPLKRGFERLLIEAQWLMFGSCFESQKLTHLRVMSVFIDGEKTS